MGTRRERPDPDTGLPATYPRQPRPSAQWLVRELAHRREHARLRREWDALPRPQVGSGQLVVLVPGWSGDDHSMRFVRAYLSELGFDVHGWGQGRHGGDFRRYVPRVTDHVERLGEEAGGPVALVGHSMGGWVAREVARSRPDLVGHVVTLGAPVAGGPKHTLLGTLAHRYADPDELEVDLSKRFERPLVVPVTAIRSTCDAIVPDDLSRDLWSPAVRHVDIDVSHSGLIGHAEAFHHLAAALAEWAGPANASDRRAEV